jgi:hypothetical protein
MVCSMDRMTDEPGSAIRKLARAFVNRCHHMRPLGRKCWKVGTLHVVKVAERNCKLLLVTARCKRSDNRQWGRLHRLLCIVDYQYNINLAESLRNVGRDTGRRLWCVAKSLTVQQDQLGVMVTEHRIEGTAHAYSVDERRQETAKLRGIIARKQRTALMND